MMYMPKKGYRICLNCGKLMQSHDLIGTGKNKICPNCGSAEKGHVGERVLINQYQAMGLFKIITLQSKEFAPLDEPEIKAKYAKMYDDFGIPDCLRIC